TPEVQAQASPTALHNTTTRPRQPLLFRRQPLFMCQPLLFIRLSRFSNALSRADRRVGRPKVPLTLTSPEGSSKFGNSRHLLLRVERPVENHVRGCEGNPEAGNKGNP